MAAEGSDLGSDSEWMPENEVEDDDFIRNAPGDRQVNIALAGSNLLSGGASTGLFGSRNPSGLDNSRGASLFMKGDSFNESLGRDSSAIQPDDGDENGSTSDQDSMNNDGHTNGKKHSSLLFSMAQDFASIVPLELVNEEKVVAETKIEDAAGKSVLDCVVEMFKGTICQKKRSLRGLGERWIWLSHELNGLCWKSKKSGVGRMHLNSVKKLKVVDKELVIETSDGKRTNMAFTTEEEAKIWLTGLSCLVPKKAHVVASDKLIKIRSNYDPLKDSYAGKALQNRKLLNDYLVLDTIGRGSHCKVKIAVSKKDKQFYAVKLVQKTNSGLTQGKHAPDAKFAAALQRIKHPNVLRYRDVLYDPLEDTQIYVVQYLARGVVMESTQMEGVKPMSEESARELMRDVVLGLDYLHQNGIAHLDIKPSNFLRGGDGAVRISDLIESRIYPATKDTQQTPAPGTPAFAAPELCMHSKSPAVPSELYCADIWSLGVSLFYMVFGRAPFIGTSLQLLHEAICTQKLVFPQTPKVSKKLKELLTRMLVRDPTSRASLLEVKNHAWFIEKVVQPREFPAIEYDDLENPPPVQAATWNRRKPT